MTTTSSTSKAFDTVRVYCVEFIQKRDLPSLRNLHENLKAVDQDSLDEILPYVLFPFQVILKNPQLCNDILLTESLQCLCYIFSNGRIKDWNVFNDILGRISRLISSPSDDKGPSVSEECQEAASLVFLGLFDYSSYFIRKSLYNYSTIPLLGHVVSILLSVAAKNIARESRLAALRALRSLCEPSYCKTLEQIEQRSVHSSIADCMACFLPGVSTALTKIISDSSSGQKVRCSAIDVLGVFIVMTVGDLTPKPDESALENIKNTKLESLIAKRDDEWTKEVVDKLGKILEVTGASSNSDEWSVRLSCVKFCGRMLLECRKSLKKHANILLNVPVKLLHDEYHQVQDACSKILDQFSSNVQQNDSESRVLSEILEENLFMLSTSLPGIMRTSQDSEKLSTLKVLLGHLSLLKEKMKNLIYSLPHLTKLASALLHCYELDPSMVQMLNVSSTVEAEISVVTSSVRMQFKHFRDDKISSVLSQICRTLGRYGDIEILTDYFIDIYNSSETNCKQSVIVLMEILPGVADGIMDCDDNWKKLEQVIKSLLDEFLSPENWYLVTNFDSEYFNIYYLTRLRKMSSQNENMSLYPVVESSAFKEASSKQLKSNMMLCCMHLEAMLKFSHIMKEKFCSFLVYVLYPVLEKTTDKDVALSTCAIRALKGIALNCGYNSVSELIAKNVDYLISDVSIQIRKLDSFPRCPAVLQAMLDHSDGSVLPLLYDTVDEIVEALDLYHLEPQKLLIFIPVLLSVVNGVNRWMKNMPSVAGVNCKDEKPPLDKGKGDCDKYQYCSSANLQNGVHHHAFVDKLRNELLQRERNKKIASLKEEIEVDPDWDPVKEQKKELPSKIDNDEQEQSPMEIQVTKQVLNRCIHLMAHSNPRVRMRIMEVVESGMVVLSKLENELLPVVHKLWSPLIAKFGDSELQVVIKAFDTLCVVATYAKDFLRKRFGKEVLPRILSTLESQASNSKRIWQKNQSFHGAVLMPEFSNKSQDLIAFKHSVAFKLQHKALSGLGPLIRDLDVKRKDHISICTCTAQYLSSRQPIELQKSAVMLFQYLMKVDPDLTWLELNRLWCHKNVLEPHNCIDSPSQKHLKNIYLGGSTDPNNEFSTNIRKLLNDC